MSDLVEEEEEALAHLKSMGVPADEEQIREVLRRCGNSVEEAFRVLMPESPLDQGGLLGSYHVVSGPPDEDESYEADVDMRDTDTHQQGSGGESDHDSTTVSYSVDEERIIDVEEDSSQTVPFPEEEEEEEGGGVDTSEFSSRPEGPPPRYEDIVANNQGGLPSSPAEIDRDKHREHHPQTSTPGGQEMSSSSSIEFPLTHFYELEGRVHTEQWSIPYKRDESLAICMVATTKMIREGRF